MLRATVVAMVLVAASPTASAGQAWREAGLASFDTVWQLVNDTYVDPTFGGLDWVAVREELRPRAERATSAGEQRVAIRDMLARLGQSHFALLSTAPDPGDLRGEASVPFDVRLTPEGFLVSRLHRNAEVPLHPGNRILRIDDHDVARLVDDVDPEQPRRSELHWRRVMRALSGTPGSRVRLTVDAPGVVSRVVDVRLVLPPGEAVTVGNLPMLRSDVEVQERSTVSGRRVGFIRFNVWMAAMAEPFAEAIDRFRHHDGLIIDLRGNPGGLADMIRGIAGHLVSEPVLLGRMRMRDLALEFRANPRRSTTDGRSVVPYSGPVAVLVDEWTASASECFAGGLQAVGRVTVFGTRTAGQALPAATQRLVNGDVLMYAVGDFVTSTGRRLEGAGVVPDVEVALTSEGLLEGRDAEAAALDWLDQATPR